jgi:pimeloyl-ACP methyl ester carboxylesterase
VWVFSGLADAVAGAGYRVTTYDLRGHGASGRPRDGYTSAVMGDDFRSLHAALGLSPALVVGHSFGGVIGVHTALLHPECVAGVILSDSFFPGLRHIEPNFGRPNIWVDLRETFRKVGIELGEAVDFARLFRTAAGLAPEQTRSLEKLVGPVGRGWLRQLPLLAETTCGDDVLAVAGLTADRIASLPCSLVALYDEFSPFLATCRWLEENVQDCKAEVIPAAKHLAIVENTAAFTDAVLRHLKRLAGRTVERRCTS